LAQVLDLSQTEEPSGFGDLVVSDGVHYCGVALNGPLNHLVFDKQVSAVT